MRYLVAAFAALFSLLVPDASAQGIVLETIRIVPPRPTPPRHRRMAIRLKEHRIKIRIDDQVARTEVTQVFHNPNPWQMEGVYLFPLPKGAAVSQFSMSMAGKQVEGEILDARRARDIYRSIVHRRDDPGLLEFAGRRCIRARLFPIPARGDVKIILTFGQILQPEGGLIEMTYPMRSDKFARGPIRISGEIDVRARAGIATLFSPSHRLDVVRKGENHVLASFEEAHSRGDRDLRLLYSLGRREFGIALSTHRPAGEDGYFLMLVAPNTSRADVKVLPKDIVFVIDTSGSMGDRGGRKMRQAKKALGYALGRLSPKDRFNVIGFATEARPFRDRVIAATKENVEAALAHVKSLQATGGTAIESALAKSLRLERVAGRVPIVIFLTDGQPTIGKTAPDEILAGAQRANTAGARLFVFGVGDDVNTKLLTDLADQHHGSANYVTESENIEVKVSALYDKVASPVLTDVTVRIDDVGQYDVYPRRLGDLFKGQQMVVVGRYKRGGPRAITLSGRLGDRRVDFVYEASFGSKRGQTFLPRLWAVRKVGFLMGEIRRNGERAELVDSVRNLGIRHGIVTPYTSFLAVEERELMRRRDRRFRRGGGGSGPAAPESPSLRSALRALDMEEADADDAGEAIRAGRVAGKGAVRGAKIAKKLKEARRTAGYTGRGIKTVDQKTFRLKDGVWTDIDLAAFLKKSPDAKRVKVKYLSDEYDKLLDDDQLARYLSVGSKAVFVHDGTVYEIE